MEIKNYIALALLSVTIGGCTIGGYHKDFGCSGLPDGVVCKTPSQIYDMTHGEQLGIYQEDLDGSPKYSGQQSHEVGMFKSDRQITTKGKGNADMGDAMVNLFAKPQFQSNSNPMPVLEQPKVLRIWVAPWKDENETLNWGSFMFTEVTPRRWNFGNSVMRNTPITAPNRADFKSASETVTPQTVGANARSAADIEVEGINNSIYAENNPSPKPVAEISPSLQRQNDMVSGEME